MRKDKRPGKQTLADFMATENKSTPKKAVEQSDVIAPEYTQEYIQKIQGYNKRVTIIDSKYSSLRMNTSILVRCFAYEPVISEAGIVEPIKAVVPVKTPNGQYAHHYVENPFPFSQKAVVVATPSNSSFKTGDIVLLKEGALSLGHTGDAKNGFDLFVGNSFQYPTDSPSSTVRDMDHVDYGYVTIGYADIICTLDVE